MLVAAPRPPAACSFPPARSHPATESMTIATAQHAAQDPMRFTVAVAAVKPVGTKLIQTSERATHAGKPMIGRVAPARLIGSRGSISK